MGTRTSVLCWSATLSLAFWTSIMGGAPSRAAGTGALQIVSLARAEAGGVTLSWTDLGPESVYTVELCDAGIEAAWRPAPPAGQWPTTTTAWTDLPPLPPLRFYRVKGERLRARLLPEQLLYGGAFALPPEFVWGAGGAAYDPSGAGGAGSLLITGFEADPATFAEVGIPEPVVAADWASLPVASLLAPMVEFDGALIETQLDPDTTAGSAIEWVPARGSQTTGKVYGAADWWYAVSGETFPTVWFAERDGTRPRGLFHVGPREAPFHGNRCGDYLFSLPDWFANSYTGGRSLVTGKARGAFGGSMGPTLFAFHPWAEDDPAGDFADAVPMLWYRELYPDCAGPNVGDKANCDYPGFTMCDKWTGASFVEGEGTAAIVLLGVKGLGENGYGPPDPGDCSPYQGYHCDPFERQVLFYDIYELGAVAAGERDAWTVVPYAIWRPSQFFLGDAQGHSCGETGGMAFDAAGQRLFLIEKGLGNDNSAVVHLFAIQRRT